MKSPRPTAERPGKAAKISRFQVSVRGVVQGVGFRPFIYQLATKHGLNGWVCNTSGEVRIEVEGKETVLAQFMSGIDALAPPVAYNERLKKASAPPVGYKSFEIRESVTEEGKYQLVSPDIATCPSCVREI